MQGEVSLHVSVKGKARGSHVEGEEKGVHELGGGRGFDGGQAGARKTDWGRSKTAQDLQSDVMSA